MWAYDISITSELHMKVAQYLGNEVPLAEFENWFYSNLGDLMVLPPSNELYLAGEIQLGLAELGNEDITEGQFRENPSSVRHDETYIFSGTSNVMSVSTGAGISGTIMAGNIVSDDSIVPVPTP